MASTITGTVDVKLIAASTEKVVKKSVVLCDHTWELDIYPYGSNPEDDGYISVFLSKASPGIVFASYAFFLNNFRSSQDNESVSSLQVCRFENTARDQFGCPKFVPRGVLESHVHGFSVDGWITLTLSVTVWPLYHEIESLVTNLRMLIVEDSLFQRKLICRRLTAADSSWYVDYCSSGEEAVSIVEKSIGAFLPAIDIIIIDENLSADASKLQGHDVVQLIRQKYNLRNTVIIGCTANWRKHSSILLQHGCDSVWSKPLPSEPEILEYLISALSNRRANAYSSLAGGRACPDSVISLFPAVRDDVDFLNIKPDVMVVASKANMLPAHKVLLISISDVFADMLLGTADELSLRSFDESTTLERAHAKGLSHQSPSHSRSSSSRLREDAEFIAAATENTPSHERRSDAIEYDESSGKEQGGCMLDVEAGNTKNGTHARAPTDSIVKAAVTQQQGFTALQQSATPTSAPSAPILLAEQLPAPSPPKGQGRPSAERSFRSGRHLASESGAVHFNADSLSAGGSASVPTAARHVPSSPSASGPFTKLLVPSPPSSCVVSFRTVDDDDQVDGDGEEGGV